VEIKINKRGRIRRRKTHVTASEHISLTDANFQMAAADAKRLIIESSFPAIQSQLSPLTDALYVGGVPDSVRHVDMRQQDHLLPRAKIVAEPQTAAGHLRKKIRQVNQSIEIT